MIPKGCLFSFKAFLTLAPAQGSACSDQFAIRYGLHTWAKSFLSLRHPLIPPLPGGQSKSCLYGFFLKELLLPATPKAGLVRPASDAQF